MGRPPQMCQAFAGWPDRAQGAKSAVEKPGRDIRAGRKLRVKASRSRRVAPDQVAMPVRGRRGRQPAAVARGRGPGVRGDSRARGHPAEWRGKHGACEVERRHDNRADRAGRPITISLVRLG